MIKWIKIKIRKWLQVERSPWSYTEEESNQALHKLLQEYGTTSFVAGEVVTNIPE